MAQIAAAAVMILNQGRFFSAHMTTKPYRLRNLRGLNLPYAVYPVLDLTWTCLKGQKFHAIMGYSLTQGFWRFFTVSQGSLAGVNFSFFPMLLSPIKLFQTNSAGVCGA